MGRPALPRCSRCRHRLDQHRMRASLHVCVLCEVSDQGGACSQRMLAMDAHVEGIDPK